MRLQELADQFGLQLNGNPDDQVDGVATLAKASSSQIAFLANPRYLPQLETTSAGVVLLHKKHLDRCKTNALIASDPYLAYARIAALFDPRPVAEPGIHESAVIDDTARLGENASIGAHVSIGANTTIGDGCTIMAGTVIGPNCVLENGCLLYPNVSLINDVVLGKRVIIHPGAVIGGDGFGIAFAHDPDTGGRWEKVPQIGGVRIGDDCEIGANSCVDRGAIEPTMLEHDVRIDNLVQIGHNVQIGAHTAIAGGTSIAGSTKIGRYCLLAGKTGIAGHISLADRTTIAGGSNVMKSVEEPGQTISSNIPGQVIKNWQRNLVHLLKLDGFHKRIKQLEKNQNHPGHGKSENNE